MSKKRLTLKSPLRNFVITLTPDVNNATNDTEICVSAGRKKGYSYERVVFTWGEIKNCYLNVDESGAALWVGRTAFDVLEKDVDLIAMTFGIRVQKPAVNEKVAA